MKKLIGILAIALLTFGVTAYAQGPGYGYGPGMGPGYGYGWGPGMGPGYGYRGGGGMMWGPGYGNPDYAPEGITLDKAKEIAKQYTDKYLPGYTVEHVLPYTGMPRTMYGVELKGPKGEVRYLRINPWGGVMPFGGGPWGAAQ